MYGRRGLALRQAAPRYQLDRPFLPPAAVFVKAQGRDRISLLNP
jgi:hypothetical protein